MPHSLPNKALKRAYRSGEIAVSEDTLEELSEVLYRRKFDKYFVGDERLGFISRLEKNSSLFLPEINFTICRDPKDNKFLELAIAAKAYSIITGDDDLLVLNPFRGIPIVNASDFLNMTF